MIVGQRLRTYLLKTIRSVRFGAPGHQLLVIDNASPVHQLRKDLARIAEQTTPFLLRTITTAGMAELEAQNWTRMEGGCIPGVGGA